MLQKVKSKWAGVKIMHVLRLWQAFQNCSWLATMLRYSLRARNRAAYETSDSIQLLNSKPLSSRKNPTKYCICICNKISWCNTFMRDKQQFYQQWPSVEGNYGWYFKWDQNLSADAECSLNKMRILEPKKLASLLRWRRKHYNIDLNTVFFIKGYTRLHTVYKSVKLKTGDKKLKIQRRK